MPKRKPRWMLDGSPHSYGLLLVPVRAALAEEDVQNREEPADESSQYQEDNRGQVVTEHDESLYHRIEIACNKVLLSA